ncbi:septum formation family protein [Dactylosporangium sp. AC04546]|uniref:septum formation family protein n=1 Tax=Dactylosporangium sp. AC04546 TaxID=2862460 RepID=UPI001EDEC0B7|nr:septum formation family protein [Dactylosporangium sp. AC04546]WVK79234.1 septum formation family protein [Dactylosporangium sp. AC04546]
MRRITLVALAAVLLTGCSGTDGKVTDGLGALPVPSAAVPATGACLATGGNVAYNDKGDPSATPVDCAKPHKLEVVQVARFPDSAEPPGWGSPAMRAAYADCGKAASGYLGGDWHTGWLFVHVGRPSTAAWAGGARSYVCGVAEFQRTDWSAPALERTGSLRGTLAGGPPKCAVLVGNQPDRQGFYTRIAGERRTGCTELHDAELAAVLEMPDGAYPGDKAQADYLLPRCVTAVTTLLGLTREAFARRSELWVHFTWLDDENEWQAGERTSLCYAIVSASHQVRASLKGVGAGPLPY